jgi:signal transduction histidine kinase
MDLMTVSEDFHKAFDATNALIMVINPLRNVVFANKALYELLEIKDPSLVLGRKPGEVVKCIHAEEVPEGCGSSVYCVNCTAFGIMKKAVDSKAESSGEAVIRIRRDRNDFPLNVYEHVQPMEIKGNQYYVITLLDVSDRVKRRFLEKIFFHDILNTVGVLKGLISILQEDVSRELYTDVELIRTYFDYVIEEIQSQKQILAAENNELEIELTAVNSLDILRSVREGYSKLEEFRAYKIVIVQQAESVNFNSDAVLLRRVIANMLKNALEASEVNDEILLGCEIGSNTETLTFWVRNKAYIEEEIQKRIFERSFSTKGKGRGLGTYSIKLLGERYLKGKVTFTSDQREGTAFYLSLPLAGNGQPQNGHLRLPH